MGIPAFAGEANLVVPKIEGENFNLLVIGIVVSVLGLVLAVAAVGIVFGFMDKGSDKPQISDQSSVQSVLDSRKCTPAPARSLPTGITETGRKTEKGDRKSRPYARISRFAPVGWGLDLTATLR